MTQDTPSEWKHRGDARLLCSAMQKAFQFRAPLSLYSTLQEPDANIYLTWLESVQHEWCVGIREVAQNVIWKQRNLEAKPQGAGSSH